MKNLLTLISNPANPALSLKKVEYYFDLLPSPTKIDWLSNDEGQEMRIAADFYFDGDIPVLTELNSEDFDFAFQISAQRERKLLVADMDSTIIQVECIDELADFAGLKDKISAITEAAMQGKLDFEQALRDRVRLLKGLSTDYLQAAYTERVILTSGAKTAIKTLEKNGVTCLLVSGGFTYFTDKVAEITGFTMNRANILEIKDNKLTGEVLSPIVDSSTKINTLNEYKEKLNLSPAQTMAIGDGANDIPMIEGAGLGIAFHAKEAAAKAADVNLKNADLTALLYLQGIKQADFI